MPSHLSNDEFFTKLVTLLQSRQQKGHGSIFLTQKRLPAPADDAHTTTTTQSIIQDAPFSDLNPDSPLPILVRATDGNSQTKDRKKSTDKIKLGTVVQPDELEAFFVRYAEVCKAGMQALKKRDRSKRKKQKQGKKKTTTEDKK